MNKYNKKLKINLKAPNQGKANLLKSSSVETYNIKDNSKTASNMAKELKSGPMELGTKDSGKETKCVDKANFTIKMEISMKAPSSKTWFMAMEPFQRSMAQNILAHGFRTTPTEKAPINMKTIQSIQVNSVQDKSMDKEKWYGKTSVIMKEHGSIIYSKGMECSAGMMEEHIKDNGKMAWCTVMEFTHGLMAESTKESTTAIQNMATVYLPFQMIAGMREVGSTEKDTVKDGILPPQENTEMEFGMKTRE